MSLVMDKEYVIKNLQVHDLIQYVFAVFRLGKEALVISLLIWGTWAMATTWGIVDPMLTMVLSLGLTYTIVDRIIVLIIGGNRGLLWLTLRVFALQKVVPKEVKD